METSSFARCTFIPPRHPHPIHSSRPPQVCIGGISDELYHVRWAIPRRHKEQEGPDRCAERRDRTLKKTEKMKRLPMCLSYYTPGRTRRPRVATDGPGYELVLSSKFSREPGPRRLGATISRRRCAVLSPCWKIERRSGCRRQEHGINIDINTTICVSCCSEYARSLRGRYYDVPRREDRNDPERKS